MNLQEARQLIGYHYWARDRALDAVEPLSQEQFTRDLGGSFGSVRNTLVHTYSAEYAWFLRWQREHPAGMLSPETFPNLAAIRGAWKDTEVKLRAFFDVLDERVLHEVLPYRTFAGQETSSVLWHMLQHVVNHASYHRGQVTLYLRQLGAAPPKGMDLITFYRENT